MIDISYFINPKIESIVSAWLLAIAIALTLDSFIRVSLKNKIPKIQLCNLFNSNWRKNDGYWLLKPVNLTTLISEIIMPIMIFASSFCSQTLTSDDCYNAFKDDDREENQVEDQEKDQEVQEKNPEEDQEEDQKEVKEKDQEERKQQKFQSVIFMIDITQLILMSLYRIFAVIIAIIELPLTKKIVVLPTYVYAELSSTAFTIFVMTRFVDTFLRDRNHHL
ncbi:hypothetical protein F8M41_020348 [Gigaspora margarita]|uniref:Uncharacterized protein n=1 Tax=Gigaspora margarita TaxID=4874 RepID=A0A8H4EJX0_GIGMA|nr:hypothetical protein F8M41_020348 [Gigaspora margarita]